MNDNELDDLFRSNADYLADQPPQDFDKEAFWQQMQTSIPRKADRKNPRVWIGAAAVLLAGMFGGIWWIESEENRLEDRKLVDTTQGTPPATHVGEAPKQHRTRFENSEKVARVPQEKIKPVSSQTSNTGIGKHPPGIPEKPVLPVPFRSPLPETEPVTVAIKEYAPPEPGGEAIKPLLEATAPATPGKPPYRVVHINEIKAQKQQEAKARTRMAFRIGLPSGTRITTQSDHEAPLSIPIQN
jgi:hypothetical protein